jgi:hypothetical protein
MKYTVAAVKLRRKDSLNCLEAKKKRHLIVSETPLWFYTSAICQKKTRSPCLGAAASTPRNIFFNKGAMLSSIMQSVAIFLAGHA